MNDPLFPYYEGELLFIRELAKDFAVRYPAAAGRLLLEPGRSADPHVERLIEAFALLTGRIRAKLDDEFPELTDALLHVLYPHYLAPIPSLAVVQFDLDPARAKPLQGHVIPPGSMLQTSRVGDVPCKFRTCYPVTLWPITLTEAQLLPPPWPAGIAAPSRAVAALRLRLETPPDVPWVKLALQRLRFYLYGDTALVSTLYELIFNHCVQVTARSPDVPSAPTLTKHPEECLFPVGFEKDEGLLPYPPTSHRGYRLLTEYFAFPGKFLFVDVGGWDQMRAVGVGRRIDITLFLNRSLTRLEQVLDASMLRLGCTPVVNLFEQTAEPISLTHLKPEYKIVPDVSQPMGYEVYSIRSVTAATPDGDHEYQPFYTFHHGHTRHQRAMFYYPIRRASLREADRGTDVYLAVVDSEFRPTRPADEVLVVRTLCSNRDLPLKIARVGDEVRFEPTFAAPIQRPRCLRPPTAPLRPPLRRGAIWRLISHLNLNYLSLCHDSEGRAAFQEMLRLYDYSDPQFDSQIATVNRQIIEGILELSSRRVTRLVSSGNGRGIARGLELILTLDENKYVGTSMYLFAAVLERFLGLYVTMNSFTQLVARAQQGETLIKRWPPRAGEQALI